MLSGWPTAALIVTVSLRLFIPIVGVLLRTSVHSPTRRWFRFVLDLGQARCDGFDCYLSKGDRCGFMLKQQVIIGLDKIDNFIIPPLNFQCSIDSLIQIDCKHKS